MQEPVFKVGKKRGVGVEGVVAVCFQILENLQSITVILSVFVSRLLQKVVLGHIFKNLPLKKAFFAYLHTSMQ